ncbi:MAG: LamG domain-containing protein [Kiritimatiellae bacterium]|nr:LamG domain-containing protein [Verrucomicrobiota bacterium]MCG2679490.1 LamG domain-containing protein [Kiritimatiellia bacterium]
MNTVKHISFLLTVIALIQLACVSCTLRPACPPNQIAPPWGQFEARGQAPSLAIDLVDGSRLIGVPGIVSISVQTAYAKLDIALKHVRSITVEKNRELAVFEMTNGDRIKGAMIINRLVLQTAFGKVSVGLEQITKIDVISGGSVKGLLAEYLFNGNANDSSGNGNNGKVHGATLTKDRYGNDNSAYYFKDTNTFITASDRLFPDKDNPRSISFWIYIDVPPEVGAILLTYGTPENNKLCCVGLDWRGGRRNASYSQYGAAFLSASQIPLKSWHNITYTYGGNGRHKFYVDGMENSGLKEMSGPVNTVRRGTFYIGCYNEAVNLVLPFIGAIDDVRVFNRELSAEDVLAL